VGRRDLPGLHYPGTWTPTDPPPPFFFFFFLLLFVCLPLFFLYILIFFFCLFCFPPAQIIHFWKVFHLRFVCPEAGFLHAAYLSLRFARRQPAQVPTTNMSQLIFKRELSGTQAFPLRTLSYYPTCHSLKPFFFFLEIIFVHCFAVFLVPDRPRLIRGCLGLFLVFFFLQQTF